MGQNSVYIAIEDSSLDVLWQLDDESFRDRVFEIEEDESFPRLDIAKIWDALHCTLTGVSASMPIEGNKLSEAIVGVHPKDFDDEDDSVFVSVIDHEEINEILLALEEFDSEKLSRSIDPEAWKRQKIYPQGIWNDDTASLVEEMNTELCSIRAFFRESMNARKHVLVTIF